MYARLPRIWLLATLFSERTAVEPTVTAGLIILLEVHPLVQRGYLAIAVEH